MFSPPEEGGLRYARGADNNIIISDSTLRTILPPQLNNISAHYKVICGCECCVSSKVMHTSLLSWQEIYLNRRKDLSQNAQNRRSGEMYNILFKTYKTLWWSMGAISLQQNRTCPWLQCVHIHHLNMDFHTGNLCCIIFLIYHVLIFQAKIHIIVIPLHRLQ